MKTLKIYSGAKQVLIERYKSFVSRWNEQNTDSEPYSISEWANLESGSDPDFFRWILNDPEISDFGSNLSEDECNLIDNFIDNL